MLAFAGEKLNTTLPPPSPSFSSVLATENRDDDNSKTVAGDRSNGDVYIKEARNMTETGKRE